MAEKSSNDQIGSIPKKPPKRPTRDYSNLPQRPITLKQAGKKKSISKQSKSAVTTKSSHTPAKKAAKKTTRQTKEQSTDQWLLQGITQSTRELAQQEAMIHGLTLEAWLEQLILNHPPPQINEQGENRDDEHLKYNLEQIIESLGAIEQRLERIEEQRGFWSRFWDLVKDQEKRNE
jgi:hypothetical protein